MQMGWTDEEEFLCVQDDGLVVIHNMFGKYLHTFNISQKVQDSKVVDARIFISPQNFTGIAVMTANYKIFLVNNIQEPKMRQLSELPSRHLFHLFSFEKNDSFLSSIILINNIFAQFEIKYIKNLLLNIQIAKQ